MAYGIVMGGGSSEDIKNALKIATEAKQAAEKAQEAAGEAASSCENKPFTLSAESWSQLDTPKGECKYSVDIAVDGITADDIADVIFGVDSFDTLSTSGVSTGGETGDNKVTLYAVSAPETEISGTVIIYKGGK